MDAISDHLYNPERTDKGKNEVETTVIYGRPHFVDVLGRQIMGRPHFVDVLGRQIMAESDTVDELASKRYWLSCLSAYQTANYLVWSRSLANHVICYGAGSDTVDELASKRYSESDTVDELASKRYLWSRSLANHVICYGGRPHFVDVLGRQIMEPFKNHRMLTQDMVFRVSQAPKIKLQRGRNDFDTALSIDKGGSYIEHTGENTNWVELPSWENNDSKGGNRQVGLYNTSSKGKVGKDVKDTGRNTQLFKLPSGKSYDSKEVSELKEMIRCKVCLEADLSIVFLPCRHMATCERCASVLQRCPICRSTIETFFELNYE